MKEQRWPGDYQTISQEFASSRAQEQMGLMQQNRDLGNDYMAYPEKRFNRYQVDELDSSWSNQLDVVGMQPHAREYLEHAMNCKRSERKFEMIADQVIDYTDGIQFSGRP